MVLDSSALLAIIKGEAEYEGYLDALDTTSDRNISAATLYEAKVFIALSST